jgi:hypothetical protein
MHVWTRVVLSLCSAGFLAGSCQAADAVTTPVSANPPFTLEASQDVSARFPGSPRLHSFAWAQWNGKWIFIAGRTGGYHGVGAAEADFPRDRANARIWVVDPSGDGPARTFSFPVAALPASLGPVKDQWMSSNLLFFQDRDTLYLAGGYGQDSEGAWVTYPILSSVQLPALVEGVMHAQDTFSRSIAFVKSPLVQVAGGELLKLDDGMFYIAGGHIFSGTYREFEGADEKNSPKASQKYIGEIRKLRVKQDAHGQLAVSLAARYQNPEFARRDLNAGFTILADGHSLGAGVYGGVFTKDQLSFTKPIYWSANHPPQVDDTYEQKMSAYACARLLLFDPDSHAMYTTFFGGISRWIWDYHKKQAEIAPLVGDKTNPFYFDGMEWVDHITTLVRGPRGTYEAVQPSQRLAAYIGTNGVFLPAEELRRIREDASVFDLKPLKGKRTLAGYLYGGIRAFPREFPYLDESPLYHSGNVPTRANDLIIAVYITAPPAN